MALGRGLLGRHSALPSWALQGNGNGRSTAALRLLRTAPSVPKEPARPPQVWGEEGSQRKAAEWSQLNRVCMGRAQRAWPGAVWLQLECPGPAFAEGVCGGGRHSTTLARSAPPPPAPVKAACAPPCTGGAVRRGRGNGGGRCPTPDSISAQILWELSPVPPPLLSLAAWFPSVSVGVRTGILLPHPSPTLVVLRLCSRACEKGRLLTRCPWNPLALEPAPPAMPSPACTAPSRTGKGQTAQLGLAPLSLSPPT